MAWNLLFILTLVSIIPLITSVPSEKDRNHTGETFEDNFINSDDEFDIKFDSRFGVNPSWQIGHILNKNSHRYNVYEEKLQNATNGFIDKPSKTDEHLRVIPLPTIASTTIKTESRTVQNKNTITNANNESLSVQGNTTLSTSETILEPDGKSNNPEISTRNITKLGYSGIQVEQATETDVKQIKHVPRDIKMDLNISNTDVSYDKIGNRHAISNQTLHDNSKKNMHLLINHYHRQNTTSKPLDLSKTVSRKDNLNATRVEGSNIKFNNTKTRNQNRHSRVKINSNNAQNLTLSRHDRNSTSIRRNSTYNNSEKNETEYAVNAYLDEIDYTEEIPEDFYDSKDILPTKPPSTDLLSVVFGFAGSVADTVAERVLPKSIYDLVKRMQKQNEAIEAEKLRSREENGGLGQFGRGILKSISSGITKPLSQLMAGARDIGSLDSDRSFVSGLASSVVGVADGVANVANTLSDAFKDRVQAIFPGTLWCGDGHSATARSSDLGLFYYTDTCCREHDTCKIFIRSGETKYGLTNTGLFTRSHCSCDLQFRDCLRKTNSLISSQIGITYFNVLGPQCFRKTHPIIRCVRRTRITGQKCEEYELDFSKPKMWQWFDSETF